MHAQSVRDQLCSLLQKLNIDTTVSCYPERDPFLRCLVAGLSLNVAQRVTTHGQGGAGSSSYSKGGPSSVNTVGNKFNFSQNSGSSSSSASQQQDNAPYRTIRGRQPVHIHPSSVLFSMVGSRKLPEYVVFAELLTTSKQYMRNVSAIEGAWLAEMFPSSFRSSAAPATADSSSAKTGGAIVPGRPGAFRNNNDPTKKA